MWRALKNQSDHMTICQRKLFRGMIVPHGFVSYGQTPLFSLMAGTQKGIFLETILG